MEVDRASPAAGAWAITVPTRQVPAHRPEPPARTRWLALGTALLVGLAVIGVGAAVRRSDRSAAGTAALRSLRPGPVRGVPGASYAVTWVDGSGLPVRWNPCRPIRWVTNSAGAPAGAIAEVTAAVSRLSTATGIDFRHLGETAEPPSVERPGVQARYGAGWAPLLVAWAPLGGTTLGAGLGTEPETVGVATPVAITRPGKRAVIVSAQVVLESQRSQPPGFGSSAARGAVALHELAHAVGLGHVADPAQLMSDGGATGSGPGELQAGDLAGLAALGAAGGCLDEPDPTDR